MMECGMSEFFALLQLLERAHGVWERVKHLASGILVHVVHIVVTV